MRERFIPGTHLIRYGDGDWNDSLQPVDPKMRDWMVSSWTVALLFQQLARYAEVLRRAGRAGEAEALSQLARRDARATSTAISFATAWSRAMAVFEPDGGRARAAAAPERHAHGPHLFAAADDAEHHRRAVHAATGARTISGSSASTCSSPTAPG